MVEPSANIQNGQGTIAQPTAVSVTLVRDWVPFFQSILWPLFGIFVIFQFKKFIKRILEEIAERIKKGANVKVGPSGLELSDPQLGPASVAEIKLRKLEFISEAIPITGGEATPTPQPAAKELTPAETGAQGRENRIEFDMPDIESKVTDAITKSKLFPLDSLFTNMKMKFVHRSYFFDALVEFERERFVIEIKNITKGLGNKKIDSALTQVRTYVALLDKYQRPNDVAKKTNRGILVILDPDYSRDVVDGVGILKFDLILNKFTNLDIIENWIAHREDISD